MWHHELCAPGKWFSWSILSFRVKTRLKCQHSFHLGQPPGWPSPYMYKCIYVYMYLKSWNRPHGVWSLVHSILSQVKTRKFCPDFGLFPFLVATKRIICEVAVGGPKSRCFPKFAIRWVYVRPMWDFVFKYLYLSLREDKCEDRM